jgi:hypothetical protein
MQAPPKRGRPTSLLTFQNLIEQIHEVYDTRNKTEFAWADAPPEELEGRIIEDESLDE